MEDFNDGAALRRLYERPGFMIRRAHQIATSIFLEVSADLGATTTQYGVLTVLAAAPDLDQITVARRLGLDRSTTSTVLRTLEEGGNVTRSVGPDRRCRRVELTEAGRERLVALHDCAAAALERLLAPLTEDEAAQFGLLLRKLTTAHNDSSRVPMVD